MYEYDYLVVGCGMFGIVFAQQAAERAKKVLIIDKRNHIGGNCYTENIEGINVHRYGAHIFHTNNDVVWSYVNRFANFNHYVNRPKVFYKGRIYSFPINLMTLHQLWGVKTPKEAKRKLEEVAICNDSPKNLEEWILSQVGEEIYNIFIKGYTTKHWKREPSRLPASIIKRLPIRLDFNDNYFNDKYQGIPIGGYARMLEKMLQGQEVRLNTDYFRDRPYWERLAHVVVYTGKIDEFFDYKFGKLEYRGLKFKTELLEGDYQGNAVMNYADIDVPYTRIIEHKHFEFADNNKTVVTWEYPDDYSNGKTPYYPINDEKNNEIYSLYEKESRKHKNVIFGGRLATYKYLDMDRVIHCALKTAQKVFS